ncbi:MAG: GNAT family N-acetyltransferase [Saprospiraceae bacterium]|nr:GNAT family N-acetyltransferase [Saprospiraceae bacterium]
MYETDKLLFRKLATPHAPFILKLVNTEGWLNYIGDRNVHNEQDVLGYIQKIVDMPKSHCWVVSLREGDDPIGIVTLFHRSYLEFNDLGFAFLPAYHGKGYAFEAAHHVMNFILNENNFPLLATCVAENTRSISLLEKLGFTYVGEVNPEGEGLRVYGVNLK